MRRPFVLTLMTLLISGWFLPRALAGQLINEQLSLVSTHTQSDPTPVEDGPAGTFTITATFRNAAANNLTGLALRVAELSGGSLLLNADGGVGGTGSTLTVPRAGNYFDGVLSPGEGFRVELTIGLASPDRFTFLVNALGAAAGDCGLAGPDQVIIYQHPDRGGACALLHVGGYPNASAFGLPDDSISAIDAGSEVRAILYQHPEFRGKGAHFEGGYYDPIGNVEDQTSSIDIFRQQGGPIASVYEGDFPHRSESFWADEAQGLANDGANWFTTNNSELTGIRTPKIFKVPLSVSLASKGSTGLPQAGMPTALARLGYNHFGDPDYSSGFLFVTIEGPDKRTDLKPRIAVFSGVDLRFLSSFELWDSPHRSAPWVAIRPGARTLWVSVSELTKDDQLREYDIDWDRLGVFGQLELTPRRTVTLIDRGDVIMQLKSMQGGVFNPEGTMLYTSNHVNSAGHVHVFVIEDSLSRALLQARSENGYGPFNFATQSSTGDEAEGLDWLDVEGLNVPGIPKGRLHLTLLNNDFFDSDSVYVKHYSY